MSMEQRPQIDQQENSILCFLASSFDFYSFFVVLYVCINKMAIYRYSVAFDAIIVQG